MRRFISDATATKIEEALRECFVSLRASQAAGSSQRTTKRDLKPEGVTLFVEIGDGEEPQWCHVSLCPSGVGDDYSKPTNGTMSGSGWDGLVEPSIKAISELITMLAENAAILTMLGAEVAEEPPSVEVTSLPFISETHKRVSIGTDYGVDLSIGQGAQGALVSRRPRSLTEIRVFRADPRCEGGRTSITLHLCDSGRRQLAAVLLAGDD